jgi:serine/threonine protein phosphatase PrpC
VLSDQKAVDIVKKCTSAQEASQRLVETALALGTMDNTTAIVVKLDWALDFVTHAELEGNTQVKHNTFLDFFFFLL